MPMDILGAGEKNKCMMVYFRILSWFFFMLPLVTAVFWGFLVLSNKPDESDGHTLEQKQVLCDLAGIPIDGRKPDYMHDHTVAGIGIMMIAVSMCLGLLAFVKIRWSNWRFKRTHMMMLCFAWLLLVAF
jgi:hypothetical protein